MTPEHKALVAELKQTHAEVVQSDGGECPYTALLRRSFEAIEALAGERNQFMADVADCALHLHRYKDRAEAAEAKLAAAHEELRRLKWHPEKANP